MDTASRFAYSPARLNLPADDSNRKLLHLVQVRRSLPARPAGCRACRGGAGLMVFGAFERMVAFRYLRARRQEGFVSVIAAFSLLGIMLGVGTLIIVMSVMNGFRAEFLKQIQGFQGDISVLSRQAPAPLQHFDDIAAAVRRVPGVVDATPIIDRQAVLKLRGSWSALTVRGTRLEDLKRNPDLADHIVDGRLDDLGDDTIMLGFPLALSLGVHVGDTISLLAPGAPSPNGPVPRERGYRVVATFDTGGTSDQHYGFVTLAAAQTLFGMTDGATSIQVFVQDHDNLWRYRSGVATAAGDQAQITDWQEKPSAFLTAIKTERNVMFFILTLIILVAAFNIISSMIMLVRSKGRGIAILRTMGATRGMVLRIFFLAGASIGVVGTLLGLAVGLALAENVDSIRRFLQGFCGNNACGDIIYFLSRIESKVDPMEVISVVSIAFVLSFLATAYPAWRAARLDPVEALRYE